MDETSRQGHGEAPAGAGPAGGPAFDDPVGRDWLAAGAAALGVVVADGVRARVPDLLAAVLDAVPDGVKVSDRDGRAVYENRALRERFGPALQASCYLDGDARMDLGLECPAASVLTDGLPHEVVREVTLADGGRAYFEYRSMPLFDAESRLAGVLTVVRDETRRVLLERERARAAADGPAPERRTGEWLAFERERQRFATRLQQAVEARTAEVERGRETLRSILDGIPDAIALVEDDDGRLVFKNAAAEALPEDLKRTLKQTLCRSTLAAGRTVTRTVEHTGADGRTHVFETFAYPVPGVRAGRTLAIQYARDITERKALERQAIRNERLAVVGELAAGLAHEIRTPLTSISNSVRLLEGALPGDVNDDVRLVLGIIAKESKRLSALLTDFLKFARPRPPRPVATDLNALVREVARIARASRPQAEGVALDLDLGGDLPLAPVDPDQLQQAVLNVVVNALEASLAKGGAAGRAWVRLGTAGPRQGRAGWEIAVTDTGPGIDPTDRARLFEPFFSKKSDGTGLGLAIAKRIVDAHAGRIEVTTAPGAGATFTLVLPAASGSAPLEGA